MSEEEPLEIKLIRLLLDTGNRWRARDAQILLAGLSYDDLHKLTDRMYLAHGLAKDTLSRRDFVEQRGEYAWRKGLGDKHEPG